MKLLLIDDDEDDLFLFSKAFEELGLEVSTCRTLDDAIKMLTEVPHDTVLLDVGLNGWDTLRKVELLHNSWPKLRIGILTGLIDPCIVAQVSQVRSVPWVLKPMNVPKMAVDLKPWLCPIK